MSLMLIAVAGWLVVAAVVGLFAWALARAAARGDRDQLEHWRPDREQGLETQ